MSFFIAWGGSDRAPHLPIPTRVLRVVFQDTGSSEIPSQFIEQAFYLIYLLHRYFHTYVNLFANMAI